MSMKVGEGKKLGVETDNGEGGGWGGGIKQRTKKRSHTVRAILPYPAGKALAGAIDRVAGAIVGAEADLSAGPPIPAAWTHYNI